MKSLKNKHGDNFSRQLLKLLSDNHYLTVFEKFIKGFLRIGNRKSNIDNFDFQVSTSGFQFKRNKLFLLKINNSNNN